MSWSVKYLDFSGFLKYGIPDKKRYRLNGYIQCSVPFSLLWNMHRCSKKHLSDCLSGLGRASGWARYIVINSYISSFSCYPAGYSLCCVGQYPEEDFLLYRPLPKSALKGEPAEQTLLTEQTLPVEQTLPRWADIAPLGRHCPLGKHCPLGNEASAPRVKSPAARRVGFDSPHIYNPGPIPP